MAWAMASICNHERGSLGVTSGHGRKTLRLLAFRRAPDAGRMRTGERALQAARQQQAQPDPAQTGHAVHRLAPSRMRCAQVCDTRNRHPHGHRVPLDHPCAGRCTCTKGALAGGREKRGRAWPGRHKNAQDGSVERAVVGHDENGVRSLSMERRCLAACRNRRPAARCRVSLCAAPARRGGEVNPNSLRFDPGSWMNRAPGLAQPPALRVKAGRIQTRQRCACRPGTASCST